MEPNVRRPLLGATRAGQVDTYRPPGDVASYTNRWVPHGRFSICVRAQRQVPLTEPHSDISGWDPSTPVFLVQLHWASTDGFLHGRLSVWPGTQHKAPLTGCCLGCTRTTPTRWPLHFWPGAHWIPDWVSSRRTPTNGCPHGQPLTWAEEQRQVPLTDLGSDDTRMTFPLSPRP